MTLAEAKSLALSCCGLDGFAWRWEENGRCFVGIWPTEGTPKVLGHGDTWVEAVSGAMKVIKRKPSR